MKAPFRIIPFVLSLISSVVVFSSGTQTIEAQFSSGKLLEQSIALALPKNPNSTAPLVWERSREADTISCSSMGGACLAAGIALTTYPDSVWDNGLYTPPANKSAVSLGTQWASWSQKNSLDIRHFKATFTLPDGIDPATATGILYDPYYPQDIVPINDDLYLFINGSQIFSAGTNVGGVSIGGQGGSSAVANETDGRYIPDGINLSGFQPGLNILDIVTVENSTWGGLGYLVLRFGTRASTYSISGRVTDGYFNPIPGVTISDNAGHTTTTNAIGGYSLSALSSGIYTITPSMGGYSFSPPIRLVTVLGNRIQEDFLATEEPTLQACAFPFFSQRDPGWITATLGTDINSKYACSLECSTIGACGCALTSVAMVLSYYGANMNPSALSSCMGTSACPLDWSKGASSCSNGKATLETKPGWYSWSQYGWSYLDQQLNQYHRPVILGLCLKGTCGTKNENTHFVVVLSGQGSNAVNYEIYDPWRLVGVKEKLNAVSNYYDFESLSVYSGQLACGQTSTATSHPVARALPRLTRLASTSVISGTPMIYSMTNLTMTVQLLAQSSAGNISDMLLWTDTVSNTTWQPFATLVALPVSSNVYAQFRDESGNISDVQSDSIFPAYAPRNLPNNLPIDLFLPMISK